MKRKLALILSALLLFVLLPQAAMAEVVISGTAAVGETLSVTLNDLDDTVQWYFGETEDGAFEKVANATEGTLTVPRTLIGYYLKAGITPVGSEDETFSAPVKVRGEINEIVNLSFDNEADLAAFTCIDGVTASVEDGVASFKGEPVDLTKVATTNTFQGTIAPDVFVAEARVKYDVTNGKKGGLRFVIGDGSKPFQYRAQYSTNSTTNAGRNLISSLWQTSNSENRHLFNQTNGNQSGQYVTLRVTTDLTAQRIYISSAGSTYELDCTATVKDTNNRDFEMYELNEGIKYSIEIVGGETYVDSIRFFGLNDVTDVSAQKLKLRGTAAVGRSLRMDYTYNSISGKAEGTPEYKWYMADTAAGPFTDANVIAGATSSTLPLGIRQSGKWVKGVVIPNAADGTAGRGAETKAVYVTPATEMVTTYEYNTLAEVQEHFTLGNAANTLAVTQLASGNYAATVSPAEGTTIARSTTAATSKDYAIGDDTADIMVLETSVKYSTTNSDGSANTEGGGIEILFGNSKAYNNAFIYTKQESGSNGDAYCKGKMLLNNRGSKQMEASSAVPVGEAKDKFVKLEYVIDRAQGLVEVFANGKYKDSWKMSSTIYKAPIQGSDLSLDLSGGGYKFKINLRGNAQVDYVKVRTYKTPASFPTLDVMSSAYVVDSVETKTLSVGEMGGRIRAINYSTASQGITIVMAAYAGNLITDIVVETVNVPAMKGWQDVDLTQTLTVTEDTTRTAIFTWDGMGTMYPLIGANNLYKSA